MVSSYGASLSRNYPMEFPYLNIIGLPLLYVGSLTVPLGFARSEVMRKYKDYDYGYEQA